MIFFVIHVCNRYREVIAERIQQIKVGKGSESAQRCAALREQDQLCQDNIRLWKENAQAAKKKAAMELSTALFASTTMAKSMLLEEQGDRNAFKDGSIQRVPGYSGTIIDIPPSFDKAIAQAKTYVLYLNYLYIGIILCMFIYVVNLNMMLLCLQGKDIVNKYYQIELLITLLLRMN